MNSASESPNCTATRRRKFSLPVAYGSEKYLAWLRESTQGGGKLQA